MRGQRNGPCVFPRRKLRSFGGQIRDVLVLAAFTHQVVQHENAWSHDQIFGEKALDVFRDALVEMNPIGLQVLETMFGFSVTIHDPSDGSIKSTGNRS